MKDAYFRSSHSHRCQIASDRSYWAENSNVNSLLLTQVIEGRDITVHTYH